MQRDGDEFGASVDALALRSLCESSISGWRIKRDDGAICGEVDVKNIVLLKYRGVDVFRQNVAS